MTPLYYIMRRALGGIRRRPLLHFFSLLTLTATFLSFAATLTAAMNLDHLLNRLIGSAELTVYLKEGAARGDMDKLVTALGALPEVAAVDPVPPERAKFELAAQLPGYEEMLQALPDGMFPASIDVHLDKRLTKDTGARAALASRIEAVTTVARVDQYEMWFGKLNAIAAVSRIASIGFGLLSVIVAFLVVSAITRDSVGARQREIEVLSLVGATRRYIRTPFQLEGAIQTIAAMSLALLALHLLIGHLQGALHDVMPLIGIGRIVRLGADPLMLLIAGSGAAGFFGAWMSLRKTDEAPS